MKTVLHKSADRGYANHGWLDTHHTFSFGNWYNPNQMHFGALRVLNDDIVSPENGFGQHPHADMEIVSIPLKGALTHRDTMGHAQAINTGDVQVMSAGTGLQHSEFNESKTDEVNFLQLWIFPEKRGVEPRYDQKTFDVSERKGMWQRIVQPKDAEGSGLWVHQNAYMHLIDLKSGDSTEYQLNSEGNGVYFFVIEGALNVADQHLDKRDGLGVWESSKVSLSATGESTVLAIEVPMELPQY